MLGKALLCESPDQWQQKLEKLKTVDWRKVNPEWIQRSMQHGKLSKSNSSIQLMCNGLKRQLGLKLTPEESALEEQLSQ